MAEATVTASGGVQLDFAVGGFEEQLKAMPDVPAASEPNQGERRHELGTPNARAAKRPPAPPRCRCADTSATVLRVPQT